MGKVMSVSMMVMSLRMTVYTMVGHALKKMPRIRHIGGFPNSQN